MLRSGADNSVRRRRGGQWQSVVLLLIASGLTLHATSFQFVTGQTVLAGGEVNAVAIFDINPGNRILTLQLLNLEANPRSVGQLISGITFTLSGLSDVPGAATIVGANATEIIVDNNGIMTEQNPVLPNTWAMVPVPAFTLCEICPGNTGSPSQLLIGPPAASGEYEAAKGSIAGNDPHNPFLLASGSSFLLAGHNTTPTWQISLPSLQTSTVVTEALFRFGTTYGQITTPGTLQPGPPEPPGPVPEPSTMGLLLAPLAGMIVLKRRRRR